MTTNELREKVCGAFFAKHGHNGSCGYLDRDGLLDLGAELGALVSPYAIGNFDAGFGRVTGYLLGETGSKPSLIHTLAGAKAMAIKLNEMPHAPGRTYLVIPTEVMV